MKNKRLNLTLIIVLLAVVVGTGVFAAVKLLNKPETPVVKEESKTVQLLTFDTYEELTGTKIRLENMFGRIAFNKDKAYLTEGKGSIAVFPQGDYNRDDWNPYMQLDCSNTTFASSDFTDYQSITMDVYNDSDEEKQINVNFTIANYSENFLETPTITFNLKPNSWNECTYDISKEVVASYFNLASVRYMTIEFLNTVESEDDVPEALYLDNLYATKYDVAPEVSQMDYDFFEGVGFETLAEQYLMSGETAATNRLTLKRTSYEEIGMTAPEGFGEYLMSGDPEGSTWPSFMFHYGENVPNGTILTFWAYIDVDATEKDRFVISSLSDGYENGDRVSNTVAAGERPFNQWFQVKILMNDDSDVTYSFFNFDDFETADAGSRFGDKPVRIYIDNVKLEKAAQAVSVAEDGTVTLRNPLGDETVSYVIEKPFKKGEAVAFDIDFNTDKEVSIWVLAEGKWNTPTEVNEFYAKNYKTWDGKKMILADIARDVERLTVMVKYFAKENRETNVCTISNIRTAEPRVQVKANGDVVISNPAGEALYLYDVAIPVKAGKQIAFDIDFNTDEPLAVWVLAERKYNTPTEKNEFLARGFEKWDGKKTLVGNATKDVKFFTIAFQYRGEGDFSKNVCTISNIRVVDPDVTVGSDGKITIKNTLAQEFVSYDVKMPVKKGKAVRFDLDFNSADPVTVWVMAEGKWNTDTVKYEYFARNFETGWNGRMQINALATVDAEWFRIYIRYAGDTDPAKKVCTIENIGIVDYVPNVVVDENGTITLNNQNNTKDFVYYDVQMPVKKNKAITFDIDFNSKDPVTIWVQAEGKWNTATEQNEFFAKAYKSWDGKTQIKAPATMDVEWFRIYVVYGGDTDPAKKVCTISNIKLDNYVPNVVVDGNGNVTLNNQNNTKEFVYYDVKMPVKKDKAISFDIDFNSKDPVTIWVQAEGKWNTATEQNEFFAKAYTSWDGKTQIKALATKDVEWFRIYVVYGGDTDPAKKICTISNIKLDDYVPDIEIDENGDITLNNQNTPKDHVVYNIQTPVKKDGQVVFDIDINSSEKAGIWVLAESKWNSAQEADNEFYAKVFETWDGKQRVVATAKRDADFVQIFVNYGYEGNTKPEQKVATITDIHVYEPQTEVAPDGSVTLRNNGGAKYVVYDVAGPFVKDGKINFDLKLNVEEKVGVFVLADGKFNSATVTDNEFYAKEHTIGTDGMNIDATFKKDAQKVQIYVQYRGEEPHHQKVATISNIMTSEPEPVELVDFTLAGDASTEDFRYRIKIGGLTPEQLASITAGTGNKGVVELKIDGNSYTDESKAKAFYCKLNDGDEFVTLFLSDQAVGESGNKNSWQNHTITIPAGAKIYDYTAKEDLTFYLVQGSVKDNLTEKIDLSFGADVSSEDFRYRIKLTGLTAEQVEAIAAGTGNKGEVTLTANETPYTDASKSKAFYCRLNASDDFLTLFIADQFFGESGNKANWSKDYIVTIPAGTMIYGYALEKDLTFSLVDGTATEGNANALKLAYGADVSTEDFRYRIKLTGLSAAQVAAIAAGTGNKGEVTLTANGTPYTDASKGKAFYCRLNASDDFLTLFIADQFFGESGNKANWSKDYNVVIPAGTEIYGYELAADIEFTLKGEIVQ